MERTIIITIIIMVIAYAGGIIALIYRIRCANILRCALVNILVEVVSLFLVYLFSELILYHNSSQSSTLALNMMLLFGLSIMWGDILGSIENGITTITHRIGTKGLIIWLVAGIIPYVAVTLIWEYHQVYIDVLHPPAVTW